MSTTIRDRPLEWPAWRSRIIVCDIGGRVDYTTLVAGGLSTWPDFPAIGVTTMLRLPLGLTSSETLTHLAKLDAAWGNRAHIVLDASSNSTFAEKVGAMFGRRGVAIRMHAGAENADTPQVLPFSTTDGKRAGMPLFGLSRNALIEGLIATLDDNMIRLAPASDTTDHDALKEELQSLERITTEARTIRYVTPPGKHDDLLVSLALLVWAGRRFAGIAAQGRSYQRPAAPSAAAWT